MAPWPAGLVAPHLSEPDPLIGEEGSLDPLGLFPLADRLADQIAPGITARMHRIRFLTAMAVAAVVVEMLEDVPARDSGSTPQLAFEWLLVEALARRMASDREALRWVPGIEKSFAAVRRDEHLGSASYLKTPRVFGFHGVYKRLAVSLELLDSELALQARGLELVRVWEREQALAGFLDAMRGTPGADLRRQVGEAVARAVRQGAVTESPGTGLWLRLARGLAPSGAGPEERARLRGWLYDPQQPLRTEAIRLIAALPLGLNEAEAVRSIRPRASAELAMRLDAVVAYERLSAALQAAFDWLRYWSTCSGTVRHRPDSIGADGVLGAVAPGLARLVDEACARVTPLAFDGSLEDAFGSFRDAGSPALLTVELLERHERVQRAKPPAGKRPWFENDEQGFGVRVPYRLDRPPELGGGFVHPYRIHSIRSFVEELN